MKKKYKVSDVTKFTIALCLCLSLILVSIVLVNVFTHEEKSAKADSPSVYSVYFGNHVYDGSTDDIAFTNNIDGDQWNKCFVYFMRDGEPFNFPGQKNNVSVTFHCYNPNRVGVAYMALNSSAVQWETLYGGYDIASDEFLFSRTISFGNVTNNFGGLTFELGQPQHVYFTYITISFTYNSYAVVLNFGNSNFYTSLNNEIDSRVNASYNNGYDTALADVGAFNTYGTSYVSTYWGSQLNQQFAPSSVRFSPISNNGYNIYSSGMALTPDLWFGFEFDIDLVSGRTYTLNYNIYSNPDYSSDVGYSYGNIALGYSVGGVPTLITERPNYDDNTAGMIPLFNGYNGYTFTMNRNADQFLLMVRIGFINTSGNESYVFSIENLQLTSVLTYKDGYDKGFADGSSGSSSIVDTDSASYKQGYNNGDTAGYNRGYSEGVQNRYSFATLFTAAIEAPINAVLSGFDVEIMGMNLRNFYLSLFSLAIVIVVIKLILFRRS